MRKWYSLIDKVYSIPKLEEAYRQVRRKKGSRSSGVDGETISKFGKNLDNNLLSISEELKFGNYQPKAVRRVEIGKASGGKRQLGIPTIRDRVVQQSLLNVLQPIFDPSFHPSSYGYRPKRSAQMAIAKAEFFANEGHLSYVADMDLSKCFDTLDHALIMSSVGEKVSDGKVLSLIQKFLCAGVMNGESYEESLLGSPQGGIISPLLANIYLDKFDQYMKGLGIRIVRYADDILIFAGNKRTAGMYMAIASNYLEGDLKLQVNTIKSHLRDVFEGIPYLGVVIKTSGVIISEKKRKQFKDKVRAHTPRRRKKDMSHHIKELSDLLRGFSNYFRICQAKTPFKDLMGWVRRRLRMMIMTGWKSWKPLHRQLNKLGYGGKYKRISVRRWRNAGCHIIHRALPNEELSKMGLYAMDEVKTNTLHEYREKVLTMI